MAPLEMAVEMIEDPLDRSGPFANMAYANLTTSNFVYRQRTLPKHMKINPFRPPTARKGYRKGPGGNYISSFNSRGASCFRS